MTQDTTLARASDFSPEILALFDRFVHGQISRSIFLAQAAALVPEGKSAEDILNALSPDFERRRIAPEDDRIEASYIDSGSEDRAPALRSYLVRPKRPAQSEQLPVVLVVHENRGLNPHIEDIARRLAIAGFVALAPDALTPLGGYPGDEDQARQLFTQLDRQATLQAFVGAAQFARNLPGSNGAVGVIGFCYGGGVASQLATRLSELRAAVSFYGGPPPLDLVPAIRSSLQLHFASADERISAAWPSFKAALDTAAINYEAHIYPETQHGFNNDTTPRFDPKTAVLAWQRAVHFLHDALGDGACHRTDSDII